MKREKISDADCKFVLRSPNYNGTEKGLASDLLAARRTLREVRACLQDHAVHPKAYQHTECCDKIDRALGARSKHGHA